MAKLTISKGMNALKTLKTRHAELIGLRDHNSVRETRWAGANADKAIVEKQVLYDPKKLDALISRVAREIRLLDDAIKDANAKYKLEYEWDDAVLGQIE
jgi:hypothetical protein